jgi:hypothetical protein
MHFIVFLIDDNYISEVGCKSKTNKQITGLKNAFEVTDNIEIGYGSTLPLWLFGFSC